MMKLKEVKEVSKKTIEKESLIEKAVSVCNHEKDGCRNASYLINMLVNNGFDVKQSRCVGIGTATEKQMKAVYRLIHGRHYCKAVLTDLIRFLDYPEEFNKAVKVKERKIWINISREEEKPRLTVLEALNEIEEIKNF